MADDHEQAPLARRALALVQGVEYMVAGMWALVHVESFQKVTGPKRDVWLVHVVGALVTVIGAVIASGALRRKMSPEVPMIGAGSALALGAVETWYGLKRRISILYVIDGVFQAAFVLAWLATGRRKRGDGG
jgi:hypothetical protein